MPSNREDEARRSLLIIDQEPIRRGAADEIRSLFSRLRQARRKVEDFESVDKPAFARWLRVEFHEPLVEINSLQTKVSEAEDILHEVRMIRLAMGCSYHQAYVNAMRRRRSGEDAPEWEGFDDQGPGTRSDDPDGKDDAGAGAGSGAEAADNDDEADGEPSAEQAACDDDGVGLFRKAKEAFGNIADSMKAKYRELARLLHPDLRFGGDAWTNDLWARAQAAYAEKNLRELDDLLTLSRVSLGPEASRESVSDMKSAASFLKKSLASVRRQIAGLKQDMAWEFASLKDRTRLKRRISYDLENEYDELRERLDALEAQLARWSVPPARRTSPSRRRRSTWDLDF